MGTKLSKSEVACLRYLSDKMEATAHMIGEHINKKPTRRGNAIIGHGVARVLTWGRDAPVTWLPDMKAYRITASGRALLAQEKGKADG